MSQYPSQPYTPPPPPPRRPRPRAVWFFVAGALIVLAPIIFVGSLFLVLRPLTQEDAVFSIDESPVQLSLPPGEERAVYSSRGYSADCAATDGAGKPVEFRPVSGEFTYNEWTAVSRFETGDGELTFDCAGTSGGDDEIRIAEVPSTTGFIGGILIGIIVPLLLGLTGLVMLVVLAVLYATGAPRAPKQT